MSRLSCSVWVQLVVVGLPAAAGALSDRVGPSVGKTPGPATIDGGEVSFVVSLGAQSDV